MTGVDRFRALLSMKTCLMVGIVCLAILWSASVL
jgi:hypothetical protein